VRLHGKPHYVAHDGGAATLLAAIVKEIEVVVMPGKGRGKASNGKKKE
jgi:hypothetical protein